MKMEGMELVMAEDGVEKSRERGDQPREDTMHGEGVEGTIRGLRIGGAGPERRLSPLIVVARRQREHGGEVLLFSDAGRA